MIRILAQVTVYLVIAAAVLWWLYRQAVKADELEDQRPYDPYDPYDHWS